MSLPSSRGPARLTGRRSLALRRPGRRAQPARGILRFSIVPDLEIETRLIERSSLTRAGDHFPSVHLLPGLDQALVHVTVDGKIGVAMVDDNHLAIALEPIAEDQASVEHGPYSLPRRGGDVHPRLVHLGAEPRVPHVSERDREPRLGLPV